MRPSVVVEADTVSNDAGSVLEACKAVSVDALLFQGADDALDHAVLLGTVWRDKLLAKLVASNQGRVRAAGKSQPTTHSEPRQVMALFSGP